MHSTAQPPTIICVIITYYLLLFLVVVYQLEAVFSVRLLVC